MEGAEPKYSKGRIHPLKQMEDLQQDYKRNSMYYFKQMDFHQILSGGVMPREVMVLPGNYLEELGNEVFGPFYI